MSIIERFHFKSRVDVVHTSSKCCVLVLVSVAMLVFTVPNTLCGHTNCTR